jgi:hypothetical protein
MRVFVPAPSAPGKCRKVPGKSIAAVPKVNSLRDSSSIRFSCQVEHNILSALRPNAELQDRNGFQWVQLPDGRVFGSYLRSFTFQAEALVAVWRVS